MREKTLRRARAILRERSVLVLFRLANDAGIVRFMWGLGESPLPDGAIVVQGIMGGEEQAGREPPTRKPVRAAAVRTPAAEAAVQMLRLARDAGSDSDGGPSMSGSEDAAQPECSNAYLKRFGGASGMLRCGPRRGFSTACPSTCRHHRAQARLVRTCTCVACVRNGHAQVCPWLRSWAVCMMNEGHV